MKWLSVVLISLIASVAFSQAWKTVSSKEVGLTFSVPTQPQSSTRTDQGIKTRMWKSESGDTNYVVSVSSIPGNAPPNFGKEMSDGIKTGFLNSVNGKATSDKAATYAGVKGREITFTAGNGAKGALWIIDRGNRIYTLTVANRKGVYQAAQKRFFSSLKLTR